MVSLVGVSVGGVNAEGIVTGFGWGFEVELVVQKGAMGGVPVEVIEGVEVVPQLGAWRAWCVW